MTIQEALKTARDKLMTVTVASTEENLEAMLGAVKLIKDCINFLDTLPKKEEEQKEAEEKAE